MKMIFLILFILFIFCFVRIDKADAFCSSSATESFTTSGSIANINPAYSIEYSCSYHVDQVQVDFKTDTAGTYNLQYSLDEGLTWNSQFQGATNSAQIIATSTSTTYSLMSWIDPSLQLGAKDGFGNYLINNSKLSVRVTSSDTTGFVLSSTSLTPITSLDDSAVPNTGNTLSSSNPMKVCDPLDLACNLINGFTNVINFLFGMPNHFASDSFNSVSTSLNTKVPFAYLNAVFATDLTNTATSTAIPTFTLPFAGGTILGHTISIPTTSYNFDSATGTALASLRPYLNYGLYGLLIGYFIYLAHSIF